MAFNYNGERGIVINPWHHPVLNILATGHEIGHHVLGHFETEVMLRHYNALFSRSGIEKDASIIGFLCLIPTPKLVRLELGKMLDPEEVYNRYANCDTGEIALYDICLARLRIYRAFKHIVLWRGIKNGFYG